MTDALYPPRQFMTDRQALLWAEELRRRLTQIDQIDWTIINKTGSSLNDLATRNHNQLQGVLGANEQSSSTALDKHVSNLQLKTLYDRVAANVTTLSQAISSPPTQAQVQNIQSKINEVINALKGAGLMQT